MSFVEIDGWAVPIADGNAGEQMLEVGSKGRAFSGQLRSTRRSIKRQWAFRTTPLSKPNAEALRAALMGEGEKFAYSADTYGSKGTAGNSSAVYTLRGAADGHRSTDALFGKSLCFDKAATNVSAIKSTNGAHASFTPGNGSDETVTTDYYVGTGCVKLTFTGAGLSSSTATVVASAAATTAYSLSCYIKAADDSHAGKRITIYLEESGPDTTLATTTVTLSDSRTWVRVEAQNSVSTSGGTNPLVIQIAEAVAGDNAVFYIDAIQVEVSAHTTSYTATSRGAPTALTYSTYTPFRANSNGFTINIWTGGVHASATHTTNKRLCRMTGAASDYASVYIAPTTYDIHFFIGNARGAETSITYDAAWDGNQHMLTCVMTRTPLGDDKIKLEIYFDGVQVSANDDISILYMPTLSALTTMVVGVPASGSEMLHQPICDLAVLPYAATGDQISSWYYKAQSNSAAIPSSNMGSVPAILASGDFLPHEETVSVQGAVNGARYVQTSRVRSLEVGEDSEVVEEYYFFNNDQELDFILEEV